MVFSWKQISNVALRRGLAPMCGTPEGCGPRAPPQTSIRAVRVPRGTAHQIRKRVAFTLAGSTGCALESVASRLRIILLTGRRVRSGGVNRRYVPVNKTERTTTHLG
jgi:hypothetical protein